MCYCDDCQAFLHFLKRDDLLDAYGGTDIVQVAQAQVILPPHKLASVRLSEKGTLRWYVPCCNTPAGNMAPAHWSPFVGIPVALFQPSNGQTLDDVFGPPKGAIWGKYAKGQTPGNVDEKVSFRLLGQMVRFLLGNAVTGGHFPTPYFDPLTHAPMSAPKVLTPEERAPLYS